MRGKRPIHWGDVLFLYKPLKLKNISKSVAQHDSLTRPRHDLSALLGADHADAGSVYPYAILYRGLSGVLQTVGRVVQHEQR